MSQVELRIVVAIVCVVFFLAVVGVTTLVDYFTNKNK